MTVLALALPSTVLILAASLLLPYAASGDTSASNGMVEGRQKALPCMGCHGAEGDTRHPAHPKLAGQNKGYLITAMKAYRDGRRESAPMNSFMIHLSDGDIEKIAEFYAAQQPN